MPAILKTGIRKSLGLVRLEIRRKQDAPWPAPSARSSLGGILQQAKNLGFAPATVIDVGAAFGTFSTECFTLFPDARYMLVEALEEYKPHLEAVISGKMRNAEYALVAAAARSGEITINVHPDLAGSSLYLEDEDSDVNGFPRTVQSMALDELVQKAKLKSPFLLKIDAQGAELDILSGYRESLQNTEFVLLEVSLFRFFVGGPQFYDVVAFMKAEGFVAYDIYGLQYRPLDNALSQVDMVFVKEAGLFRRRHYYATREQRIEQFKNPPTS